MLILSRKIGESLVINGNITVTLVSQKQGQIKVGIEAPKNISVHRSEIQDKVDKANNNV